MTTKRGRGSPQLCQHRSATRFALYAWEPLSLRQSRRGTGLSWLSGFQLAQQPVSIERLGEEGGLRR
jgi:hypothetical protein